MGKKKLTRYAYFDNTDKRYKIFHYTKSGKIKFDEDLILDKSYAKLKLSEYNKGKHEKSFRIPTKKESKLTQIDVDTNLQAIKDIDRILKKPIEKIDEDDRKKLIAYDGILYKKDQVQKKKKQLKIKKKKQKVDNVVEVPATYTLAKSTSAFFYVPPDEINKINDTLENFKENYSRTRIIYKSDSISFDITIDTPTNYKELEKKISHALGSGENIPWSNDYANLIFEGLL